MSLELSQKYNQILEAHAKEGRGLTVLSPSDLEALKAQLHSHEEELNYQALFILAHSSYPLREMEEILLAQFSKTLPEKNSIWLLNASRKHIIQARFKDGERLTHEFLEALRSWLYSPFGGVKEWTLRTIEECGAQTIVFRSDLAKIKPRLWSLWKEQNRTILELIVFIERRWPSNEKK
ncbi:MAG: hypothetical protein K2P81_14900 [Bacteriovoracaceae bacterium]|nr:hypothetical protein [Bacteriovoracaceae bacterium]